MRGATAGRPDDVLDLIEDGADLIVPLANGEPVSVLDAVEANARQRTGVRVHQMHALHDRSYLHGTVPQHLLHVSYFLSPVTRPAFHERGCELVPNHFSEVPRLLRETTRCSLVLAAAAPIQPRTQSFITAFRVDSKYSTVMGTAWPAVRFTVVP